MAGIFRSNAWQEDEELKEKLSAYVNQGIQRSEILDFMKRDFNQYSWSPRTLCQ
jgi:hypothetical protein